MATTPTTQNDLIIGTSETNQINTLFEKDESRSLKSNDKLPSPDVIPQTRRKPPLEARWVIENGQLVCKWLCREEA